MPNELDPDYDPKGYRNGKPGRGPKPRLEKMIGDAWDKEPGDMDYVFAARGLALEPSEVPVFDSIAELQLWVFRMHGLRGSKEHFQELADRASPKPSRMQGLGGGGQRSTRGYTSAASSEAEKWFASLEAPVESEGDEDLL